MVNRKEELKRRNFDLSLKSVREAKYAPSDYSKIRVGTKILEDAVYSLGAYKKVNSTLGEKKKVLQAINRGDIEKLREISSFFYKTSGIYARLCRYMAYLYKYDWFVTPYINGCQGLLTDAEEESDNINKEQLEKKNQKHERERKKQFNDFFNVLKYLEAFEVKKFFGDVALKVIRYGCYYGYLIPFKDHLLVQELHPRYCRSRFKINNRPVIEFNMRYFNDMFFNEEERERILKMYPKDIQKGYQLYKDNKLPPLFQGDQSGWYLLQTGAVVKFNLNDEDYPAFISVIPAIIDLDQAKELDRKKMMQRLLKIIIQKMPIDKNGDLIFDPDEARQLHNNMLKMLSRAIGIDVVTTYADAEVADLSDRGTTTTTDELQKVERGVYNEAGVSQLQFNSTNNIALNNSILNDEANMYNLILQFESFLNLIILPFNRSAKKSYYQVQILPTTIYNFQDISKMYKDQAQMGYNKMLPQVALGQTQSSILANAYFENDILDLVRVFVPPLTSNTMNADALREHLSSKGGNTNTDQEGAGRPEKKDSEKSEKTIQNRESM